MKKEKRKIFLFESPAVNASGKWQGESVHQQSALLVADVLRL